MTPKTATPEQLRDNETGYRSCLNEGPATDMLLDTIDALRRISAVETFNGPSGRMLGQRLIDHQVRTGRFVRDMTVRELDEICEDLRRDYNAMFPNGA